VVGPVLRRRRRGRGPRICRHGSPARAGYTPEGVRWDLTQHIDDILLREMFDPSTDTKDEVLTGWSERDEPEDKLLRSEILVTGYYEKERLP